MAVRKFLYLEPNTGVHIEQDLGDTIVLSSMVSTTVCTDYLHTASSVTNGHVMYASTTDTVDIADPTDNNKSRVVGIVAIAANAGDPVKIATGGYLQLLSGSFTVNATIFLSATGRPTDTKPTASGSRIIKLGTMATTTIININIQDLGKVV